MDTHWLNQSHFPVFFSLNMPIIRDSHFGYKGLFGIEGVRNVRENEKKSSYTPNDIRFSSYIKLPSSSAIMQCTYY